MRPKCVDCGNEYGERFFLWLPDIQWKSLGYTEDDYACPNCIVTQVNKLYKKTFNYAFMFMVDPTLDYEAPQVYRVNAAGHSIRLFSHD